MNSFFKVVLATCLGVFLASLVMFILGMGAIVGMAASNDESDTKKVESNSVLTITLETLQIPEMTDNVDKSPFESEKVMGIQTLVQAIDHAKTDDKIRGIAINSRFTAVAFSKMQSLRQAIERFKQSGKFVVAYADFYTQGAYYMASVADTIMVNPAGNVEFRGLAAEIPFMKDLFDRLDVKWQIYYAGQFKSATEPFRFNKMSDQNRTQMREYIDGMYDMYLADVSKSRNIPVSDLIKIANDLQVSNPSSAVKFRLVDTEGYYDVFQNMIRRKLNLKEKDKLQSIALTDYAQGVKLSMGSGKDKIAVVYAEGDIDYTTSTADGDKSGTIDGNRYAKIIRKLRQDDAVKAIVLRINSGGGSVLASDIILRELNLAHQEGKVIISSFGTYAASGGYYIAMASDSIFAEPSTLTGSIGVFSMIPSFQKTLKTKLGITFDSVKTTRNAEGISVNFDITDFQGKILQAQTDSIYENFLNIVARNRHKTRDQIHAIAQGRIWLAAKGKEIGLVDNIGGLDDAIAAAANKAGLKTYKKTEYPKLKNTWERIVESVTGQKSTPESIKTALIKEELGEYAEFYDFAQKVKTWNGTQMRLPFVVRIR